MRHTTNLNTMFAFVDGRIGTNYKSKSIRSHIMTNVYLAKRKRQGHHDREPTTWSFEITNNHSGAAYSPSPVWVCETSESADNQASHGAMEPPSIQPRTILGAGQIDHFSTIPVPRTRFIDEFIGACSSPIASSFSGFN